MTPHQLQKLDDKPIYDKPDGVAVFVGIRNELTRFQHFLEHYRALGVDWFFVMDNGSDDGTRELVLAQPDCHCFNTEGSHFALNVDPPRWTNALLNVFGADRWCMAVDADELLVFPNSETVSIQKVCEYLDHCGQGAITALMIDMYGKGPLKVSNYVAGTPFLDSTPWFDLPPVDVHHNFGGYPPRQVFGGVRERVFWKGPFKKTRPPCLTKVPLVRWHRGMKYYVAQHTISPVGLGDISGALLHFKFLSGFEEKTDNSIRENSGIWEKGLQEREAYMAALRSNPDLSMHNKQSQRYENTAQLVHLGWMATSGQFERFIAQG